VYLTHLHEGAVLASLSGSSDLCLDIAAKLRTIRDAWPSTHSRGVHAHAEALAKQAIFDPTAEASFREARGLWPGPLVLFSLAQWQRKSGDFAGALATLDEFEKLEGDILRNHFTGLLALGWMERGLSLKSLSRKQEASRLFRRVLDCWGEAGASFSIVRSARQNYLEATR
jgi:tetratricopeptide (TPR) repeat protein